MPSQSPYPLRPASRGPRGATITETSSDALTPIEVAIDLAVRDMEERDVAFVAVRGARIFPRVRTREPLVFACRPASMDAFEAALVRRFAETGVVVVTRYLRRRALLELQLYAPCGPGRHHHVCLELRTAATAYGVPYVTIDQLLEDADRRRRPARPCALHGALTTFARPFLDDGFVVPESSARLSVLVDQQPAQSRALFGTLLGTRRADRFMAALRSGSHGPLAREARPFRRALFRRAFLRHPVRSALHLAKYVWSTRFQSLMRPRGVVVAVLGAEGTGRRRVAHELLLELAPSFRSSANHIAAFEDLSGIAGPDSGFRSAPPSGLLAPFATWLRLHGRTWTRLRPLRRRNTLVLLDGWIDEWLSDPESEGNSTRARLLRWLVAHAPRPDVSVITTASLRVVARRKPELPRRDLLARLAAFESLAREGRTHFAVTTDGSVDDAVDAAVIAIMTRSSARRIGRNPSPSTSPDIHPEGDVAA